MMWLDGIQVKKILSSRYIHHNNMVKFCEGKATRGWNKLKRDHNIIINELLIIYSWLFDCDKNEAKEVLKNGNY